MFSFLRPIRNEKRREKVAREIHENAIVDPAKYIIMGLAGVIVTLGLIIDSAAIVIGGMLIAPFLYPLLGISYSAVKGDNLLFRKTLVSILITIFFVVLFSFLVSLILPFETPGKEITSRSSANLIHLIVALAAGLVGALSVCWPRASSSLAGVLIAAALLPPLGIIGYGLAQADFLLSWNAFLLFFANAIAIVFMGILVLMYMGFHPPHFAQKEKFLRENIISSTVLLLIVAIPMTWALVRTINEETMERLVTKTLKDKLSSEIIIDEIESVVEKESISTKVTLYSPKELEARDKARIEVELEDAWGKDVELEIFEIIYNKR